MQKVLIEEHQHHIHVQLNRPEVRNAFHPEMIFELTKAFKSFSKHKQLRAVILSGQGPSFCAGADLEWMKSMAKYNRAQNKKDAEKLFEMFSAMKDLAVPLIGKVHGHAMGGALGMLAVCDLVAAEEKTEFCFSEVKLGLSPAVISAFVKNKVSFSQMSRWFLTGEVFNSLQAKEMGLIQEVCTQSTLDSQIEKWLKSLLANGPVAVRETKKLLRKVALEKSEAKLKKPTTDLIAQLRVGEEGQEGLQSFLQKRSPSWRIS